MSDATANKKVAAVISIQSRKRDLVIDHWMSEGKHRGAFFGTEPTGKNVRIEGFSVWRIADGRAVEAWGLVDVAGLMGQLKA